ncbi:ABC transporter permease [bacterium]|nr:ABC transporter permease [bacterium]
MFSNYLKVALRNILRHKLYSAINIAGLAVGIAAFMVIVLWVQFNLSFDGFHKNADRIYKVINILNFGGRSPQHVGLTPPPMGPSLLNDYPEVEAYCRIMGTGRLTIEKQGKPIYIKSYSTVDSTIFDIFTFEALAGDLKSSLSEPNSLVLTDETAQHIFGNRNPVGEHLKTVDGQECKVTAVVKKFPRNSHFQFDALMSFSTVKAEWLDNYSNCALNTYLLLKKGTDPRALEAKLPGFMKKYSPEFADNFIFYLQPLREIHLHSARINYQMNWNPMDKSYVQIFSAVAVLILVIACLNFMNLATARSARRTREVGLRKVLGSSRAQLIRQFLGESVFLSFCSVVLALALIELSLPFLNEYIGYIFDFDYPHNGLFLLELAGVALFTGVFAGIYPAFFLSSFKPAAILKGVLKDGCRGLWLRRSFIVLQYAISILLITYTFFVVRQIDYMRSRNLGFEKNQVLILPLYGEMQTKLESLRHELSLNPSVTGVTVANASLGDPLRENALDYQGKPPTEQWSVPNMAVDFDFIPFYRLELLAGRNFRQNAAGDSSISFILNESLVKKIGWTVQSAVGQPFYLDAAGTVIGVVRDFNFQSLHHAIEPLVLVYDPMNVQGYHFLRCVSVKIRPENTPATLEWLKDLWARNCPMEPFSYSFLDDDFASKYESEMMIGRMTGVFSALAVFIACLGLLGLISFAAESRTKEIGVRKVMGASVGDIILLLSREFLLLLGLSVLIAWPVAWYMTARWLERFAYRISLDGWTFVLAGAIALAVAAATVSFQAFKAATADPVKALRYE